VLQSTLKDSVVINDKVLFQCVAVYYSVLQCVAVCCSVLQYTFYDSPIIIDRLLLKCGCSVLQCVAICCSVLQCVAVCCNVLQCVAVYLL